MQIPFSPRLFVLSDHSVLTGQDKHIKSFVHTSIMIGRQILVRGWKIEGGALSAGVGCGDGTSGSIRKNVI